ncbi:ribosomal-protein-alanine N-acetyltransferase [Denitratisoma sp. DHT3]|uniref:ribosomal protein S18-alanine N-acetyltransferase n=1 Tax=Denitratisoma sp. DHT3 TaxID=1981880 RepID=UPI001198B2DF|nr:ribosomal protein S18-alanine N-acetyltransferase [Denitratisoma sp. DHT3]QDX80571.1 ribosomal-protein-alanine N-acetyltransferase [Denitratisoma sp. DHT3]
MSAVPHSSADLDFAPMTSADLGAVVAAEAGIYEFPWSHGNFADSLISGHRAWVACRRDRLAGYGVMMMVLDEAHLLNISVVPELQGRGLGSRLLEHFFADARAHGGSRMLLEVRPSNAAGLRLYARHGFAEIGRRRDYYPARHGREEAVVMERAL